jgi:uncharacterized membrane protein YfcA
MISLPIALTLAAAVLSTSFVSGIFGMAGGMILMGILLAIMPLATAMVLHGLTQMASNGWRAWLWREHVLWPVWPPTPQVPSPRRSSLPPRADPRASL